MKLEKINCVADKNERIDKFIASQLDGVTRSYVQKLVDDGNVLVDGKIIKSNYKLKIGQNIEITIPEAKPLDIKAEDIKLDIVYEDKHMLVVNKPQNMVVHPAAGNYEGTLVNALMNHCGDSLSGINGVIRPGIVHRIDKDTSGLLLVAKDDETHLGLSEQIKEHSLTRKYVAIVHGNFKNDEGTVDAPIGRHPTDRKRMCITEKNSKNAVTHYKVLKRFSEYTLVECKLETGRTHQIRVHMASIGHPVMGDKTYGVKKEKYNLSGQLLHARIVGFIHPITKEYMEFQTEIPERFEKFLNRQER
ncbi:MAG: RluA family pseudouridine synthase [Clostridia bacterium]|nr:RluA family pseudouridine synthase [Clostridia bacterium]